MKPYNPIQPGTLMDTYDHVKGVRRIWRVIRWAYVPLVDRLCEMVVL